MITERRKTTASDVMSVSSLFMSYSRNIPMKQTSYRLSGCFRSVAIAAALFFAAGATATADLLDVRVDIGTGAAAGTPTGWNAIADPTDTTTLHDLSDFNTGLSSGVTLQITDRFNESVNDAGTFSWSNPQGTWIEVSALYDYAYLQDGGDEFGQITLGSLCRGRRLSGRTAFGS